MYHPDPSPHGRGVLKWIGIMNSYRYLCSAAFAMIFGLHVSAQDTFNEMVYSVKQTVFNLNAPTTADAVTGATPQLPAQPRATLRIYADGQGGKAVKTVKMKKNGPNRWTATVRGDL